MDWNSWSPLERANLCFVVTDGNILLIRKKRGLGAGKINGPGGRLEEGETPLASAIRETEEELCITPTGLSERGRLHFQFLDGYSLFCTVFMAQGCHGVPTETDEAVPLWTPIDQIPYHEMWEDDRYWLPGTLEGRQFDGFFEFDGETMLSHDVQWRSL